MGSEMCIRDRAKVRPNWQATLPKNACGEPAAGADTAGRFQARRRRRGGVASATAPSSLFAWHATARGRPYEALDGVRRLSRPTVSPYHVRDVAGIASTALQAEKPTRSSSGLDASLGLSNWSPPCVLLWVRI